MGVAYLHLWLTQSIGRKGMYYRKKVKIRTHWTYYWAWVISSKAAVIVETVAMALRTQQPTADVRTYSQGVPTPWFTGPPFTFRDDSLLALNIETPDHYDQRKKDDVTGCYQFF